MAEESWDSELGELGQVSRQYAQAPPARRKKSGNMGITLGITAAVLLALAVLAWPFARDGLAAYSRRRPTPEAFAQFAPAMHEYARTRSAALYDVLDFSLRKAGTATIGDATVGPLQIQPGKAPTGTVSFPLEMRWEESERLEGRVVIDPQTKQQVEEPGEVVTVQARADMQMTVTVWHDGTEWRVSSLHFKEKVTRSVQGWTEEQLAKRRFRFTHERTATVPEPKWLWYAAYGVQH